MVKLADQARINRREFIENIAAIELDPGWLERMGEKAGRGWQAFIERSTGKIEELRGEMAQVGTYVGVDIPEFRRIVQQVQKGEKEARRREERNGRGQPALWSFRLPRNTPTGACNSLISFRKATSA